MQVERKELDNGFYFHSLTAREIFNCIVQDFRMRNTFKKYNYLLTTGTSWQFLKLLFVNRKTDKKIY